MKFTVPMKGCIKVSETLNCGGTYLKPGKWTDVEAGEVIKCSVSTDIGKACDLVITYHEHYLFGVSTRVGRVDDTNHRFTEFMPCISCCLSPGYEVITKEDVLEKHIFGGYGDTVYPATCTKDGYTTKRCQKCEQVSTFDRTKALGHDIGPDGKCRRSGCGYDSGTGITEGSEDTDKVDGIKGVTVTSSSVKAATVKWDRAYNSGKDLDGFYIYVDDSLVKDESYYARIAEVKIPYSGTHRITVCGYIKDSSGDVTRGAKSDPVSVKSKEISKGSIDRIVKLKSSKVCIHVTVPKGATGVKVYAGSKCIKTMTKSGKYVYSKSKAGSKKYKVRSYITEGGTNYYGSYSTAKSPSSNSKSWSGQGSYSAKNSFTYATAHFMISKVYYSGNYLKVTGYLYNTRIFDLKKVKIKTTVYAEGKTYKKTFTKSVNLNEYGRKKITLTFPKAKGAPYDVKASSWSTNCVGNWGFGYEY